MFDKPTLRSYLICRLSTKFNAPVQGNPTGSIKYYIIAGYIDLFTHLFILISTVDHFSIRKCHIYAGLLQLPWFHFQNILFHDCQICTFTDFDNACQTVYSHSLGTICRKGFESLFKINALFCPGAEYEPLSVDVNLSNT